MKYLYFIADTPHVIKSIRTMLLRHNIILHGDTIRQHQLSLNNVNIEPLHALASFQEDKDLKLGKSMKKETLTPKHFNTMEVSQALHVLSKSMSGGIENIVKEQNYPTRYKQR